MMTPAQSRRFAVLQMLLCGLLWSIAGLFIKKIDCHPMVIAGARAVFACLVVWVFLRLRGIPVVVTRQVVVSALFWSGTFITFVSANKLTTAANTIVLHYTSPIFILLIMRLLYQQSIRLVDGVTVATTLFGISLFFVGELAFGSLVGNLLALCSGLFMASSFIAIRQSARSERMCGVLFGHAITAAVGLPFVFFTDNHITGEAVGCLLVLGVVQSGLPYILLSNAVEHCSPLVCSLLSAVEPLLNPVWVAVFLGERPGPMALAGGSVVIGSILVNMICNHRAQIRGQGPEASEGREAARAK